MMPRVKAEQMDDIPTHFTDVIAERRLTLVEKGSRKRVLVRIGAPVRDVPVAGGLDWRCPIRITGHRQDLCGLGVDSMQALIHALQMVQITLSSRSESGTLEWLGMQDVGLEAIRTRAAD